MTPSCLQQEKAGAFFCLVALPDGALLDGIPATGDGIAYSMDGGGSCTGGCWR